MKSVLEQFGSVEEHVSLKNLNTYKIDSSTRYLLHPKSIESLQKFVKYACDQHLEYFVLGNGSNVILSDSEYPGIIVKLDFLRKVEYHQNSVFVEAGVMINKLGYDLIEHGLSGLEWATGIPGTVGGCIYGNAEAYNVSTFEYLKTIDVVDLEGNLKTYKKEEISHGYRTTAFKEGLEGIIVSATFEFKEGNKEESMALVQDRLQRRLSSQPLDFPNAGSVFRNPSKELPSGKIIDDLGLKGTRIHDACISEKHANFIVNLGHATGKDVRNLIKLIKDKVRESYHIDLILEQEPKDWGCQHEKEKESS